VSRKSTNFISESAFIGDEVVIGKDNIISPNVVLTGNVEIGDNNYIGAGAVIGGEPRQRIRPERWDPKITDHPKIKIGNDNLIFENVTIHQPVGGVTVLRDSVAIGAHSHIGHDSHIGDGVVIATNVTLGGYTIVQRLANIGLGVVVHPRCVIGYASMCGMGACIKGHVIPGTTVTGVPAKFHSINQIGLSRHQVSNDFMEFLAAYLDSKGANVDAEILLDFDKQCSKWIKPGLTIKKLFR